MNLFNNKVKLNIYQIIALVYFNIILIGSILLVLPISYRSDTSVSFMTAFFTATSAVCVTGLSLVDIYTTYTLFGQAVVLLLIEIGGLGFMSFVSILIHLTRHQNNVQALTLTAESLGSDTLMKSIGRIQKRLIIGSAFFQTLGAAILFLNFLPLMKWDKAIWFGLFHSVSAFCNAGFDLMGGTSGKFSSLTGLAGWSTAEQWYITVIVMLLIFVGGLGFFVWHDVGSKHFRLKRLNLQSKMVLSISAGLVVAGALALAVLEWNNSLFADLSVGERINASLFQSVSARTAGFNSIDLAGMTEGAIFVMICLMFIGGSTGSTAGGIKTTTFWILCISIFATFRRKKNIEMFGRRMDEGITRTASCVFMTYLLLTASVAVMISAIEKLPLLTTLFESVSAMATVGLTLGITPGLGMVSKLLLAFLMLCGRVGSITMLLAFSSDKRVTNSRLPLEKVQVG